MQGVGDEQHDYLSYRRPPWLFYGEDITGLSNKMTKTDIVVDCFSGTTAGCW